MIVVVTDILIPTSYHLVHTTTYHIDNGDISCYPSSSYYTITIISDSVQGVFPGQGAENGDDDAQSTVNSLAATLYPAYIKHYLDQSAEHVEGGE